MPQINEWIRCYLVFLNHFDFDEYLEKSDDDFMTTSLIFLDTYQDLALKRNDYMALFDVQLSKAPYYVVNKDFSEDLREELKLFLMRLNPISKLIIHEL